ncbi:MAG: SDR family oxidoreductase [Xanthomonadales bacterium]|nr:SDR family oxidoreductase [Xanthomonadales bacterium]
MARILITGSARGIGLELVRHYLAAGHEVIAVCRDPGPALSQLPCERIDGVELSQGAGIDRVREAVSDRPLDILIHCAGILRRDVLGQLREQIDQLRAQFEVNTLAPLLLTEALLPVLQTGSKVAMITSRMGSIGDNSSGGYYGYRMSKAALNCAGKSLAINCREREIAVALLHPGFVRTQMTGGAGDVDPAAAAAQLVERINALTIATSGSFWHANGSELPW